MSTTAFKVPVRNLTNEKRTWLQERIVEYARIYNLVAVRLKSLPKKYIKNNCYELYKRWVTKEEGKISYLNSLVLGTQQIQSAMNDAIANFESMKSNGHKFQSQKMNPNIIKFTNSEYKIINVKYGYAIVVGGKNGIALPLITNSPEKETQRISVGKKWGIREHLELGIKMQEETKERNKQLNHNRKKIPNKKREKKVKAGLGVITYNLRDNTVSIPETTEERKLIKGEKQIINTFIGVDLGINNTAVFTAIKMFPDTYIQAQELIDSNVKNFNLKNIHTKVLKVKVLKGFQTKDKMKQLRKVENKRRTLRKDVGHRRSDLKEFTNHYVSHEIAKFASKFPQSIVIFEKGLAKLKNPTWSPADVKEKSEYKLNGVGISTFDIYPAYTSQICSHCGAIGTRVTGTVHFSCTSCGLGVGSTPSSTIGQYNADVNASINIALRGLRVLTLIGKTVGYEAGTVADPNIHPRWDTAREATTTGIREAVEIKGKTQLVCECKDVQPIQITPVGVVDETKPKAQADGSRSTSHGKRITCGMIPPRNCVPENGFSSFYKQNNNFAGRTELDEKTKISEVLSQSEFSRM